MKKAAFYIIAIWAILMPTTVLADNEPYVVLNDDNTKLTFFYDDQKSARNGLDLTLSSWVNVRNQITSVEFDSSFANCETINSTFGWFYHFTSLESIIGLTNLKTDNVTDMRQMFSDCPSLTSLDLSGFKTDNVTTMRDMFSSCSSLNTLDVSGFNTSEVTDMSFMFSGCISLTSLNIKGLNTSKVENMYHMFSGCKNLTSLDVSGFKTDNVNNMEYMFYGCSNLETLDVSGFNTGNVTDMNDMFSGCSNLTSLDVSGFKTDNVTGMSFMFNECSSLKSLDVSGFNTEKVTNMGGMFSQCRGLTSLDVSGFNTEKVTSVVRMFFYCESLKSLDISGFKTDKVNNMTSMFEGCSGLSSLNLVGVKTENVNDMTDMFYHCRNLKILDISGFKTGKVNNMRFMFSDCINLETIYVGDGWSTTKVTDSEHMFGGCDNLVGGLGTKYDYNHVDYSYACIDGGPSNPGYFSLVGTRRLTISSTGNGSVTYDNNVISNQTSYFSVEANASAILTLTPDKNNTLKGLVVNGEDVTSNVVENQYTVSNISANTTVEVEFKVENEPYAVLSDNYSTLTFYFDDQKVDRNGFVIEPFKPFVGAGWHNQCEQITSVAFDASFANCESITSTAQWFWGCINLTTISGISNLKTNNVTDMQSMFHNCSSLSSLDVSGFNTDNVTNMGGMFNSCSNLESLDLSKFKTDKVTSMNGMFGGCSNLETIYVGSGWSTASITESDNMFSGCNKLVGGMGTVYDANHSDCTYARIDGGVSEPGYFTSSGTYRLTITATGNGKVSFDNNEISNQTKTFTVEANTTITISLIPNNGYYIDKIVLNDEDVISGIADNQYTINNANSNILIEVGFDMIKALSIDGIEYSVVSAQDGTVKLAKGNYGLYLTIPDMVNAHNIDYSVIGVETDAFDNASELAAIIWNPESKFDGIISNPNLLLYVKSADYAPDDIKNVIVNNVAKSITLADAESGNNFYCPQEFTAEKITYVHNYSMKTGYNTCQGWESIVLPFDVAMITNNSGIALVPHSNWTYGDSKRPFWLYSISENGWNAEPAIKANKPYIISMPNNENYDEEYNLSGDIVFSASDIKVAVSDDISSSKSGHRYLIPNYLNQEKSSEIYALNVNNLWDKNTESDMAEGSAFVRGLRQVRPFEAYMTIDSGGASTRSVSIFDGNTTGIFDHTLSGDKENISVYSISGSLIKHGKRNEVLDNLPKGIYIIDKKKVIVN